MNLQQINEYKSVFDAHAHKIDDGEGGTIEVWYARELQSILGYARWENFTVAINRATDSCKTQKINEDDHFRDLTKMVNLGSGSQRAVSDIMLTRYACYLIAQNGDPKKDKKAFAQCYFTVQTRCAEKSDTLIELFELDKSGIHIAQYLTELPSKEDIQLHKSIAAAKAKYDNFIDRGENNE